MGTGKFIEVAYKDNPNSEIISAIYNYDNAKFCHDVYLENKEGTDNGINADTWLDKAIKYASDIPDAYEGEFSEEILALREKIIDDNQVSVDAVDEDEDYFRSLSISDKQEIKDYINSRYAYYDEKEGGYSGDKYSEVIWVETSKKYNVQLRFIDEIWLDSTLK